MTGGYLKLWRSSLDSEVFHNEYLWRLWSYCLMKTTYKARYVRLQIGGGVSSIQIEAGQFIFGRTKAAEYLCWKPSTLWKRMLKLQSMGNIKIDSSNKQFSIVTICNWADYQGEEISKEQRGDNEVTTKEQRGDTNKKDKKDEKDKKITTRGANKFTPPTQEDVDIFFSEKGFQDEAEKFFDHFTSNGWKVGGKAPMKDWQAAARNWIRRGHKDAYSKRKTKHEINAEIQEIGNAIKHNTGFNPYATIETSNSCIDVDEACRSLPQLRTYEGDA